MRHILWFSIAICLGFYIGGPLCDPDLWWHITVGKWIVAHQTLPSSDQWNMFWVGKVWRAYSWAPEIFFAFVAKHWGDKGLLAFQFTFACLLSLSLFYCFGKISRDWFFGALLGVFATLGCFNHFALRPQVLVWIYLAFLLAAAAEVESSGLTKARGARLALIMCLWANTHITASLAIFAVAAWLFNRSNPSLALRAGLWCFAGTLVTPYAGGEWITFFQTASHPFTFVHIMEFEPATLLQYATSFLVLLVVLLLSFLHQSPRLLSPGKLFAGAAFVVAGLAINKFLPFAMVVTGALLAASWAEMMQSEVRKSNLAEGILRLGALVDRIPQEGLSFVFICLSIVNGYKVFQAPLDTDRVPAAAVDFMIAKKLPRPIANDFGSGGYLMYRLASDRGELSEDSLVSMDGRTNVIPKDVFVKFENALNGKNNWKEYLELIKPETIFWPNESPLTSILLEGRDWCRVFKSGGASHGFSVFVKRDYAEKTQGSLSCS